MVKPIQGLAEPMLWVQRMVIWGAPDSVLRSIPLRPGLNVIWSPDPGGEKAAQLGLDNAIGHGAGKSLFCRLMRYCLGEPTFAPEAQQRAIQRAFPDGLVGAEVRVAGRSWSVVRPLGHPSRSRASAELSLEQLLSVNQPDHSFDTFVAALADEALGPQVRRLMPAPGRSDEPAHPWLMALAWLARDQECRFSHILDWRAAASDSESPARGRSLSRTDQLDALRALLRALLPEEQVLREHIEEGDTKRKQAEQDAAHAVREIARQRVQLARELGLEMDTLPSDELCVEMLRKAARARFARVTGTLPAFAGVDLDELEGRRDQVTAEKIAVELRLKHVAEQIEDLPREIRRLIGELNLHRAELSEAEEPICGICEVPIDHVLAAGCKLSHKLPNLPSVSAKYGAVADRKKELELALMNYRAEQAALGRMHSGLSESSTVLEREVQARRAAEKARSADYFDARRAVDRVRDLGDRFTERQAHERAADQQKTGLVRLRELVEGHRRAGRENLQRLSELYNLVVQSIIGSSAEGEVRLTGNGLEPHITMGGERFSAALDSLKVVAFDVAALLLAVEGRSAAPAFLIHDSPREADLGDSLYQRLFFTVKDAEGVGDRPTTFQYILTTTTPPPEELRREPWLCLTLRGTPADERLLRKDL